MPPGSFFLLLYTGGDLPAHYFLAAVVGRGRWGSWEEDETSSASAREGGVLAAPRRSRAHPTRKPAPPRALCANFRSLILSFPAAFVSASYQPVASASGSMPRGSVSRDRTVGRFTPYDTVSNDEHLVGRPQPNLPPSRPTNPPHSPDPTDDPHLFSDDELDDSRRYPRGSRPVPTSPSETTSGSGSRSPRSPLEEALAAASAERNSPPSDDAKSSRRRNRPAAGEAETSAGSEGRQFGRKKNVCSDCDKSFSTAGHLQRHRRKVLWLRSAGGTDDRDGS